MLKIHCCALGSKRNPRLLVESTSAGGTTSGVDVTSPAEIPTNWKFAITSVPIETPLASQTRNLAGTVLPCLKTLSPCQLIGWRICALGEPRQAVPTAN